MYRGFELKDLKKSFFGDNFRNYYSTGKSNFEGYKSEIQRTLKAFENSDKSLNGDKMQSNWFPQIKADIFLSHSHDDEDLVIAFAGWLKEKFAIDVFIDSCVWKYSKDLQNIIDRHYSIDDGKLIYDRVLYASSHVHMMLNTALMQMIDNCECIMFLNTPNSIRPNEVVNKVVSPWIYSELGMTKLIKWKDIKDHRRSVLIEKSENFSEQLSIGYNLDTEHLTKLNLDDLKFWNRQVPRLKTLTFMDSRKSLDILYEMKPIRIA